MKRPQTKFHADTMSHSNVLRSKKSQNLPLGQNLSIGQNAPSIKHNSVLIL